MIFNDPIIFEIIERTLNQNLYFLKILIGIWLKKTTGLFQNIKI